MKKKKILLLTTSILLMTMLSGCTKIGKSNDGTIVSSTKFTIVQQDLDKRMDSIEVQLVSAYGDDYKGIKEARDLYNSQQEQMLTSIITEKVMRVKAEELSLMPTEEQINIALESSYETLKTVYGKQDTTNLEFLEALDTTEAEFREMVVDQIIYDKVTAYINKDLKEITEVDAKAYYDNNQKIFEVNDGMEVSQIQFDTEEEANAAIKELNEGALFTDVVAKYDPQNAATDGYIGFLEYDSVKVDEIFMSELKKLKEGEISGPIVTKYGVHVIKAMKYKEKSIRTFEEMKLSLINQLSTQQESDVFEETLKTWKNELELKVNEDNITKL